MRKNFKPNAWLLPAPVLIIGSYNEDGTANAMTAAWGAMSDYTQIFLALDFSHKTAANILKRKAFTVSVVDANHVKEADYVGMVSGNDICDKVENAELHVIKSKHVDAPYFSEFPMTFECRVAQVDMEKERVFGDIINISLEEHVLDEQGQIDRNKLNPICIDSISGTYCKVTEAIGKSFHEGTVFKK